MKNIRFFLSENFHFSEVNFSIHLNRRVFVMLSLSLSTLSFVKPTSMFHSNFVNICVSP